MTAINQNVAIDDALAYYLERLDRGEAVDLAALVTQFPACARELEQFLGNERRLNERLQKISSRPQCDSCLTIRCPECHHPTEVAADTVLAELTCGSCGSRFGIVDPLKTVAAPPAASIGRFELVERLGMGGFGTVWAARDKQLDRTVAIKVPRQSQMSADELEKFFREARAAAQLKHPNIVSVHEVGRDADTVYIVSDLVRGVTLADWLTGQQPTNREAAQLCATMAEALHHAHEKGVVHRDLKPANIMLDDRLAPHIMDFGLARREVGEVTMTMDGHVLGTPAYMSPEQAQGESHSADRRSDVYSLGVSLYQLLTGELPFRGNSRMLLYQVIHDEPPNPRKLNANIKRDLETITLKCLEKEPAKRYQTARELSQELRRYLAGEPIHARPIGRVERAVRWIRRNPWLAAASSLAVMALVTGTIISSVFAVAAKREALNAEASLKSETAAKQEADASRKRAEDALANEKEARDNADQQARLARRRLYASQTNLAQQALEAGDSARVLALLEALRPKEGEEDLRTFEWRHLWQQCHQQCRLTLKGHTGRITAIAYSPDGKLLASGSRDGTARLWDAATGKLLQSFHGSFDQRRRHPHGCEAVAFTPDGKALAVADGSRIRFWDVPAGTQRSLVLFSGGEDIWSLAFSPDGAALAACGWNPNLVTIWDAISGKRLCSFPPDSHPVNSVAFSPDGKLFGRASYGGMKVWRWNGTSLGDEVFNGGFKKGIAFSPDSRRLLADDSLGDCETWHFERRLQSTPSETRCNAFSPDGKLAASARLDRCALVWDPDSGKELGRYAHAAPVGTLAFSPDGNTLATAGDDRMIKIWNLSNTPHRVRSEIGNPGWVRISLAFVPHSDKLLLENRVEGSGILLWNSRTGKEETLQAESGKAANTADGSLMAFTSTAHPNVTVWNAVENRRQRTLRGEPGKAVFDLRFSPDGTRIAMGSFPDVILWDTKSGKRTAQQQGQYVSSVTFSPDGKLLASVGNDGWIVKRDATTGKELRRFAEIRGGWAYSAAFSPDSRTLAVGYSDGVIHLIDADTWEARASLRSHTDAVTDVAFFADGNSLVSGSSDRSIRFWDAETGQERMTLRDFGYPVAAVAIASDGNAVAAASPLGAIKLWRASTSEEAIEKYTVDFDTAPSMLNRWAWPLATSERAENRDGQRALRLALRACEETEYRRPHVIITLAAAYAETSDFESAVKWAQTALDMLPADCDLRQKQEMEKALENYKAARPTRVKPEMSLARTLEGETLQVIDKSGGEIEAQAVPAFGWSWGGQLWWRDANVGDILALEFDAPKAGRYKVIANLTKARDYGTVQLAINGEKCDQPMDRYFNSVMNDPVELGSFELKEGPNLLAVEIIGSNEKAEKRYMFGLDYLQLESIDL